MEDVAYLAEIAPAGSDAEVIGGRGPILLTVDKDFGDLVFRREHSVPAVVVLRIDSAMRERKRVRLDAAISRFGAHLFGRYT
jgi:hypothetical protein